MSLEHDGRVSVERGLVRKEDLRNAQADAEISDDEDAGSTERPALSPRLVEDLTAQKSAAIGAELMGKPDFALATVVHSLLLGSLYSDYGQNSCLEISVRRFSLRVSLAAPEACKGFAAIQHECERVRDRLPGDPADLWPWCLARSRDELLDLLAVVAANAVNGVHRKQDRPEACRLVHAAQLASALNVDVNGWFTPTAANYFSRINRTQILAAIDEAKGEHAPALDKLKKSELAVRAESLVAGTGWLPVPMRIAANENVPQGQTMAVAAE